MKVTKQMVNEGLRPAYGALKLLASLLSRKWGMRLFSYVEKLAKGTKLKGFQSEERFIPSTHGGPDIRLRIFKPLNAPEKLPAMIYYHGGGYAIGSPDTYLPSIKGFLKARPCVVIATDYRKSLDNPFPAGFNDCYDTLLWAKENAAELGIYDTNFIVGGHSAGGGLTAAVTLKARDEKSVKIAFQMPIYPMIDDRQNLESAVEMEDVPLWNAKTNANGWNLYLKDLKANNQAIPPYAAPARNTDYSNFPPTITFVGELEPFKDETIQYVEALKKEGIPVKFKLFEKCYHGFDLIVPKSKISKTALEYTYNSFGEFYDTYVR